MASCPRPHLRKRWYTIFYLMLNHLNSTYEVYNKKHLGRYCATINDCMIKNEGRHLHNKNGVQYSEYFDTGQWGLPTFNVGVFFGLLAIVFCSVMESVGDYYATAAVCRLPPPPKEAISRGIASEGFGCLVGALLGCSHATSSFSQTIGFVGMTRVRA